MMTWKLRRIRKYSKKQIFFCFTFIYQANQGTVFNRHDYRKLSYNKESVELCSRTLQGTMAHTDGQTQGSCCSRKSCSEGCDEKTCCNINSLKAPGNFKDLIDGLYLLCSHSSVEVEKVKQFMGSYKSNKEEWKKYVNFDPHRYTRNLVDKGKFNLILLCWGESQGSSIHSHAGSHCFMKILDGEVKETQYEWPKESSGDHKMTTLREEVHRKEEVAYICDEIGLHRVENPSHTEGAVTLHLYSPPFQECNTFDDRTSHKDTATMTFYSEFGKRV